MFIIDHWVKNLLFFCGRKSFFPLHFITVPESTAASQGLVSHPLWNSALFVFEIPVVVYKWPPKTCSFTLKVISLSLAGEVPDRYVWSLPWGVSSGTNKSGRRADSFKALEVVMGKAWEDFYKSLSPTPYYETNKFPCSACSWGQLPLLLLNPRVSARFAQRWVLFPYAGFYFVDRTVDTLFVSRIRVRGMFV